MKVEALFLVSRNKLTGEILFCQGISDRYSEVGVDYSSDLVTEAELIAHGKSIWGNKVYSAMGKDLSDFLQRGYYRLRGEAKYLDSIGNVLVGIETVEVEIK